MKRFFVALAALAAALSANATNTPFVDGLVIVKFKTGKPTALPAGATVKKNWAQLGIQLIKLKAGMTVPQGLAYFKARKDVVFAEPDLIRNWTRSVNDPLFVQEYHLNRIKAVQAWDIGIGKPEVIVAVLDSGFELTHTDMQGKFVEGFDFMDNDTNPTWVSEPHGVETAGCVAAATDNAKGIASIGFNCKIMPIRVGDTGIPLDNSISGMMWAADHGAKVINMSYGGFGVADSEKAATEYAWNKGLVVIASAGNHGTTDIAYPAGFPKVIPVAATDQNDQRAPFSAFGNWVTVAAPGVDVLTTTPGNQYGTASGTSFSGPITAGLAGLLWSLAPSGTTNIDIRAAIENNCDPVGSFVTKGRINAFKSMQALNIQIDPGTAINADNITTAMGTTFVGDVASVSTSDDLYYQVGSVGVDKFGQAAGVVAEFTMPSGKDQISVLLETVGGVPGGTSMVWLWNWSTSQYVLVGSVPTPASGNTTKTIQVRKADVPQYVGPGGAVQVLVRGHIPIKPLQNMMPVPFTYKLDLLQLLVKGSS